MNKIIRNLVAGALILVTGLSLAIVVTLIVPLSVRANSGKHYTVSSTLDMGNFFAISPATFTSPGRINTLIPLSDGRILAAGSFVAIGGQATPRSLTILQSDGSMDTTFQIDARLQVREVYDAALQGDGKIVIAGLFKKPPDPSTYFLLRLNPNGSLDEAFKNGDINSQVFAILIDGEKIVIGGSFTAPKTRIARLNINGTIDSTFSGVSEGPNDTVRDIARQTNGKYIIVGEFENYNGANQKGVARLNTNGSIDSSFAPGGFRASTRVAVLTNDSVVVGGENVCGDDLFKWYAENGSPKPTPTDPADPNSFQSITSLLPLSDGGFLIGGWYSSGCINGSPIQHVGQIWRYAANGSYRAMTEFGDESDVLALALRSDGKVSVGGQGRPKTSTQVGVFDGLALLDLSNNGLEKVVTYDPIVGDEAEIYSLSRYTDGRLLVAGNYSHVNGLPRFGLARLLANGALDLDFHPFADQPGGYSQAALVLTDGRAMAGFRDSKLFLIGENGSLTDLSSFNNNDRVSALAIQSDGKILVGSDFGLGVRRLKADFTGIDPDFISYDANGAVYALAVRDNKIFVAGNFGVVRLNNDGSIDNGFTPPTFLDDVGNPGKVYSVTPLLSGGVLVGGYFQTVGITNPYPYPGSTDGSGQVEGNFQTVGGETRSALVRLTNTGALDTSFTSPTGFHTIKTICVQREDKIWVGGIENSYYRNPLVAQFDGNGHVVYTPFINQYQASHGDGTVNFVLCSADEGLKWAGGRFSLIDNQPFYGLVRYLSLRSQIYLPLVLRR